MELKNRSIRQIAVQVTGVLAVLLLGACASAPPSVAEEPAGTPSFPYRSVSAVYDDVQSRQGVHISTLNGWTTLQESVSPVSSVSWSFAPSTDPAYPAVIKRAVEREGGEMVVKTCIMCESSQAKCNKAKRNFENREDSGGQTASQ